MMEYKVLENESDGSESSFWKITSFVTIFLGIKSRYLNLAA
jgi:hypothetical protein